MKHIKGAVTVAVLLTLAEGTIIGVVVPLVGSAFIHRLGTPEAYPFLQMLIGSWIVYSVLRYLSDRARFPAVSAGEAHLMERISEVVEKATWLEPRTDSAVSSAETNFLEAWIQFSMSLLFSLPLVGAGIIGMIALSIVAGVYFLAILMILSLLVYPLVVYPAIRKRAAIVKAAGEARWRAARLLGGAAATPMPWMARILRKARRQAVESAAELRRQADKEGILYTSRRMGGVRVVVLCVATLFAGLMPVFEPQAKESSSALVLMVGVLASKYALLGSIVESIGKVQGDAFALTDWLRTILTRPLLPPPQELEIVFRRGVCGVYRDETRFEVTDVDETYGPGVHVLDGPNASGKTTRFRILIGACWYEGSVTIGGHEARLYNTENRVVILTQAVHPQEIESKAIFDRGSLLDRMQALRWAAFPGADLSKTLDAYSGGQLRRLQTAGAFNEAHVQNAMALLLDEPTNDLDEEKVEQACIGITAFADAHPWMIILVNTHNSVMRERLKAYAASRLTNVA